MSAHSQGDRCTTCTSSSLRGLDVAASDTAKSWANYFTGKKCESISSLGNQPILRIILLGGDWNFEPEDIPIDLVHGGTIHRPLNDALATSPVGSLKLD
eukprot:5964827-Amphidinium_carterae.1